MVPLNMLDIPYTVRATSNIAFIKYWGRRNHDLNLPYNSSISMTLDESLSTTTSVEFSSSFKKDMLIINGKKQDLSSQQNEKASYIKKVLEQARKIAGLNAHTLVVSKNNFPSGTGLASSAAGAAALSLAIVKALNLDIDTKEISKMARQVSGSGSRSLYGGIVKWHRGTLHDGSDSFAEQLFDADYWSGLIDLVTIVTESAKRVSSSKGHTLTPRTSRLYDLRPKIAEAEVKEAETAIRNRDFNLLAEIIMRDSNNLHAVCLDSWPPIIYLNDVSRAIIYTIHELNENHGKNVAAYTFDAGANAHIITTQKHRAAVEGALSSVNGIKRILYSKQGNGPRLLSDDKSLINDEVIRHIGIYKY